jgi:predicted transcriptional regulator
MSDETTSVASLTAAIVSAFVGRNPVAIADLPGLIGQVHAALTGAQRGEPAVEPQKPAVSIRKSITPDHLISLEDGRPYKSLKRHLRTRHNMSPQDYRTKWGLPKDYPMVAPNYSASRSALAKSLGLGRVAKAASAKPAKARAAKAAAKTPTRRTKTT